MGGLNCVRYPIIKLISAKVVTGTGTEIPIKGTHFCLTSSGMELWPDLVNDGIAWAFTTTRRRERSERNTEGGILGKSGPQAGLENRSPSPFWCLDLGDLYHPLPSGGRAGGRAGTVYTATGRKLGFPPEHTRTLVVSFHFSELYLKTILSTQSTEERLSVQPAAPSFPSAEYLQR